MGIFSIKKSVKKANVLDVLVFVVVLALLAGVFLRYLFGDYGPFGKNKTHIEEYEIKVITIDTYEDVSNFENGKVYRMTKNKAYFGTVGDGAYLVPVYTYESDGTDKIDTGKKDVVFTVIANGCYKKDGFMLNGNKYIAEGTLLSVTDGSENVNLRIISISKIQKAEG